MKCTIPPFAPAAAVAPNALGGDSEIGDGAALSKNKLKIIQ